MACAWVYSDVYLDHDTGYIHPERPDRLTAIREGIEGEGLAGRLELINPRLADEDQLEWVHSGRYVQRLFEHCLSSRPTIDSPECPICQGSYDVARRAVGGVFDGIDAVMAGSVERVFASVRPPGHHAEHDRAMGFCLLNNIALGAEYVMRQHNLERVAIVDFDVHHANGTQHTFDQRDDVLVISLHEDPRHLFPGTGYADEIGHGKGTGYTLNVPMLPGCGDEEYRRAFDEQVLPKLAEFRPQFLLVSAGFDAVREDPLAHINLSADSYIWMTQALCQSAAELCQGRLVSVLEGGYDLDALWRCVVAHVDTLITACSPQDAA